MKLPLEIVFSKSAAKTLEALDVPTRQRIKDKVKAVAADPLNPRTPTRFKEARSVRPAWAAIES